MASVRLLTAAVCVCLAALLVSTYSVQPTEDEYAVYKLLKDVLVNGSTDGVSNLYVLETNFFPAQSPSPICIPVEYHLHCNSSSLSTCLGDEGYSVNTSFLWSEYDLNQPIGALLLSYASSGIILKGFDWEDACIYSKTFHLNLTLTTNDTFDDDTVSKALLGITSQLKAYAQAQKVPNVGDTNNGYAIYWNTPDFNEKVFHNSRIILTLEVVLLNIFILFLSIAMTTYSYDILYNNVKGKKNPGYPLFWGLVLFTVCWNVGPSWLVLSGDTYQMRCSLYIMVPLQFFISLFVKKKSHFPVPLMSPRGCVKHKGYNFTLSKTVLLCSRCLISHALQVLALWSILIFLTFLIYYLSAIIIAFYLSPSVTLIKAIFIKGIVVCAVLNFALMFSISQFTFKLTFDAFKKNLSSAISLIAVVMFLPILAFLTFIIGGILFAPQNQPSALQSIITLIPTGFLLIVAWISKGHLFPEGLHDPADPAKEIASDLEKGALNGKGDKPHGDDKGGKTKPIKSPTNSSRIRLNQDPSASVRSGGELSTYGAVDGRPREQVDIDVYGSDDEKKTLV